jgi:hypothetical protein
LGQANNPNANTAYAVPDIEVAAVRILANYDAPRSLPAGTPLIDVGVFDGRGESRQAIFDAGEPIGRLAMPEASLPPNAFPVERIDGVRREARGALYFGDIAFEQPLRAQQLTIHLLRPDVTTTIYGLALVDTQGRTWQLPREAKLKYTPVFDDPDVIVYENTEAMPRAFIVPEAIAVDNRHAALRRMIDGAFDPTRTVVLESAAVPEAATTPRQPGVPVTNRVDIITYQDERIVLRADSADGGYLVLADAWYPGWRAFVDGYETPILRGNYLYRALPLGPGSHLVEFVYEPFSLRLGAAISLVVLVSVCALVLVALVRTRRSPRH